jgi:small subunit ribosomal protein S10e
MVQIQKAEKKTVYRYLLQEGVIVIHKDFTNQPHKGTNVPNIHVRMLLRSLKDRGLVELVFSWQYFYYFINNEGKKHLSEYLGLTEEVVPLTWKKD